MGNEEQSAEHHREATSKMTMVVIGVLALAFLGIMPYDFYLFTKFILFCYLGYILLLSKGIPCSKDRYFLLIAIAILFNPIFLVHLDASLWKLIDAGLIIYLLKLRSETKTLQRRNLEREIALATNPSIREC